MEPLLEDLSSGLEVRLKSMVTSVDVVKLDECRAKVAFINEEGEPSNIDADYVVIAVPVRVLQKVCT